MNSYPHEFLAHPQPLMFVAGLTPSTSQAGPSNRRDSVSLSTLDSGAVRSRSNSSAVPALTPSAAMTTPVVSPSPSTAVLPSVSPPPGHSSGLSASGSIGGVLDGYTTERGDERDKEFEKLVKDLRGAVGTMSGRGKVWLPDKERRDFRILLVDKGVRLPMRKVNPPAQPPSDPYAPLPPLHSPLSPLTPSSPLYPDGLIAPVWVRKHAELVPSVFVLFLRLYESPLRGVESDGLSAEEAHERDEGERSREKEADDLLVKEIGERRRKLGERGIKLTVVLMASAATLDSPSLDPRLSYLRRASSLSSKASLFVLTPVPASQLPDFVQSLQDALYDSAMEYYSTHAKRVRRKRARLPVNQLGGSVLNVPTVAGGGGRALGNQGWCVRYDWKMGWFAEIRGEYDVARRHYEDCWNELSKMFSSTTTLPPRTKRWAEAKVLADCVAMNICRLLLYDGDATKVLGPFFVHLKKFGDLSRGWGIGEETFEFWSWVARQYRIFAELLELGLESGLKIPQPPLPSYPVVQQQSIPPPTPDYLITPISSTNPLHVLHQPGAYYYTAALFSVERKKRFQVALEAERDASGSEAGSTSGYISTAPGFANEKKVDHSALIIELFTKAYSLFKEQEHAQTRVALYVAFRIAETYTQSGQHEMAMRFFDRISQTFKRDRWEPIVRQIRMLWYESAQLSGNVETAAKILMEMMGPDSGIEAEEKAGLQDDLLSLLQTTTPSTTDPLIINPEGDAQLLNLKAGFWQSTAQMTAVIPFQIVLSCPSDVEISNLSFSELRVAFSNDRADIVVVNSDGEGEGSSGRDHVVDLGLGEGSHSAPLRWGSDGRLVLQGKICGEVEGDVQISNVVLCLKQGSWDIRLNLAPSPIEEWIASSESIMPLHGLSPTIHFMPRPHLVIVDIQNRETGYVDEPFPVTMIVKNEDERPLELEISIFLQPGEEDDSSMIKLDDQESKTLITNHPLGLVQPSETITKIIYLTTPMPSEKTIDISIISSIPSSTPRVEETDSEKAREVSDDDHRESRHSEINRTVSVDFANAFRITSSVSCKPSQVLAEGADGEEGKGEKRIGEALVASLVGLAGGEDILVESVEVRSQGDEECRLLSSSLNEMKNIFPQVWQPGNSFSFLSKFSLYSSRRRSTVVPASQSPAFISITWRSLSSSPTHNSATQPPLSEANTTNLSLPHLTLPLPIESFITPLLHHPPTLTLNQPFTLTLSLLNTHPSHAQDNLSLQIDTNESFVWTGNRVSRIGAIPPSGKVEVAVRGVPVGNIGWGKILGIRVWENLGEGEEREIRVMDGSGGAGGEGLVLIRP